ncbi:MAG: aspartate--tRNA ligase [Clostridia bacterium]|nr:aspartate--tRNA ligase [Clostridia bacterium]
MAEFLTGKRRTCMCGEVDVSYVGKEVTLMGWVNRRRDLGSLIFIQLRDRTGLVQVILDTENSSAELLEKASSLKMEYVVMVKGVVRKRVGDNVNVNMRTGEIEVVVDEVRILSKADTPPFVIGDATAGELLRLKYRYLDLRRESLQKNLFLRSKATQSIRNYLSGNGFLEIETPFLGKSTPEGARDYLVPSRIHAGKFYALPQSPQLYKQLLMIAGYDRYFQFARCFRDEDLRANRQPEFTQVDLEMSFIESEDDILSIMEGLIVNLFKDCWGKDLARPFRRMTYETAMELYGSDKPDIRFGMEIIDISQAVAGSGFLPFENAVKEGGTVRAIKFEGGEAHFGRKDFDRLADFVKTYEVKGPMWYAVNDKGELKTSFAKKMTEESVSRMCEKTAYRAGDILFVIADNDTERTLQAIGALRRYLGDKFELIDKNELGITWVTDFPLFEYSREENRLVAKHHPFTSPKIEDLPLFDTAPEKMHANAYDLVMCGDEMGGGSIRIHDKEIQRKMFETLGLSEEQIADKFGFFVNAFNYGTPPHGGLAFGFDRLMMVLCNTDNIKDVIAFPKMQNASCVMSQAPSEVDDKQIDELHIKIVEKEKADEAE